MFYTSTDVFPKIAYRKYGEGPVVVLLHGFPADGNLWENIWPGLQGFTVIVPDFPGTGGSDGVKGELTIEMLADFVYDILQHENIVEAVIAGHSMGGYTAAAFAVKYPTILKGMAMVHSTAGADDDEKKEQRKKVIGIIRNGGKEAFIRQMVPGLFSASFQLKYSSDVALQISRSLELPDEVLINFYTAMMNRCDHTNVLKDMRFPVQWVIGKEDAILPLGKALKQSSLADINFVNLYKNCGHMSMMEQPGQLVRDLTHFLEYCYRK